MKWLDAIREFEIRVTGGFAYYFLICVTLVTVGALGEIIDLVIDLFK
ncbi:hypothetical protein JOC34_000580 [Virgibacillus halotolerans]|nr:hypothetical protein [Virgibacillus halotolerans]MBM7598223.1 hypothetical protein [Virgibacillus halotolerans]